MANILCIGASDATMATRRMLLESAGHTVTEAKDLREVTAACQTGNVDIAILGQDLPEKEKVRVGDTIRTALRRNRNHQSLHRIPGAHH